MRGSVRGSHEKRASSTNGRGLFRHELAGPGRSVNEVFSGLRSARRVELIAEHPETHSHGSRLMLDRTDGHGTWEFYRLDEDLFVVTGDFVYDAPRIERVPGEALIGIHLRMSGRLRIDMPNHGAPLVVESSSLLLWRQRPGAEITERTEAGLRDTSVTLYCTPQFLHQLAARNGIDRWPLLEEIESSDGKDIWYRHLPLSAGMAYVGRSLLQNPFKGGIRLMHAEAKVLELLCELLHMLGAGAPAEPEPRSDEELKRLDHARRILSTQFNPAPRIVDIARTIGVSESKLKRAFKARFGVTVFDYGLGCRMQHALELLSGKHLSVGQVAYAVGYRHQTSFTAAFAEFFGFLPRDARTQVH